MPKPPVPQCPTCDGSGKAVIPPATDAVACLCTVTLDDYRTASAERLAELRTLSQRSRAHLRERLS